ncbi:hypothetical protein VW35_08625 [Devosia soli]|uniref:Uncharacterized protein n=1 Tax=Devosia soli TaxID=361041 RepID=A0A0F5LAP2_9HYPH|nr:hypothetical protein [Devosia soli]KKB79254.1 hypothetical protein VW35_08625 [Devosia soli]
MPTEPKIDIVETAKILKETSRNLNKFQLRGQTPAARSQALSQQRARVEVAEIRGNLAIKGALARICDEIGLDRCLLDTVCLRGAMLMAMDSERDPVAIQRFRARDAEFQKSRKKQKVGIPAFIAVAAPSNELIEKAQQMGFKRDLLVGGFRGRGALTDLITLGESFSLTIRVEINRSAYLLVNAGEADAAVFEMLSKNDDANEGDAAGATDDNQLLVSDAGEPSAAVDDFPLMKNVVADTERDEEGRSSENTIRRHGIGGPLRRTP